MAPGRAHSALCHNRRLPEGLPSHELSPTATGAGARAAEQVRFAALHHPAFRIYFLTTMLAMMGDNIEHVISYWVLFETFHSPALGGFAVLSHWLPFLFFSVYFGALADRYDTRRV